MWRPIFIIIGLGIALPSSFATPDSIHPKEVGTLESLAHLEARACSQDTTPCGYDGLLCCTKDEVCYTGANNQPQCGPESEVPTQPAPTVACSTSESPCGSLCCDNGSYCLQAGVCSVTSRDMLSATSSQGTKPATTPHVVPTTSPLAISSALSALSTSSAVSAASIISSASSEHSASPTSATETPLSTGSGGTQISPRGVAGVAVGMVQVIPVIVAMW